MRIAAIGAHPDDTVSGCVGLLLQAVRNRHNVYTYTLTCESGSGDPEERTKELIQSSSLGGKYAEILEIVRR